MFDALTSYPDYVDSNVPWAGSIPQHWNVRRGKVLFAQSRLPAQDGDEIVTCFRDGQVTLRRNRRAGGFMIALQEVGYQGVRHGQLVIHAMDAFAGAVGISDSDGKCTPEYIVCNPRDAKSVPGYYAHALRLAAHSGFILVACPAVRERAPRLRYPDFGEMLFPVPPPDEQAAIVRFLEIADRRIRRYIRAKQRLTKLLNEQEQVIIHHAVTRGLRPNIRHKPSGTHWVGSVPEHWAVLRLGAICRMSSGAGITSMSIGETGDYPVYGGNGLRGYTSAYTHDGAFVLIGRQGALCGNVHLVKGRFWASEHAVVATLNPGHHLGWFGYILRAMNLNQYSIAAAQPGLAVERILNLRLPLPPADEQAQIAEHIARECESVNSVTDRCQREIALLREWRARLFADVVTGKVDVRAMAAVLLDEPGGTEPDDDDDDEGTSNGDLQQDDA